MVQTTRYKISYKDILHSTGNIANILNIYKWSKTCENRESLCCILETYIMLYTNYISIKENSLNLLPSNFSFPSQAKFPGGKKKTIFIVSVHFAICHCPVVYCELALSFHCKCSSLLKATIILSCKSLQRLFCAYRISHLISTGIRNIFFELFYFNFSDISLPSFPVLSGLSLLVFTCSNSSSTPWSVLRIFIHSRNIQRDPIYTHDFHYHLLAHDFQIYTSNFNSLSGQLPLDTSTSNSK